MLDIPDEWQDGGRTPIDFIVVGAGAAGAPLAARLVERGYAVLVLEMGPKSPDRPAHAVVEPTEVPLLHPATTEDPRHSLQFFVKHFDGDPAQSRDWKLHDPKKPKKRDEVGIFYPRAQGVGGCSIHNAMITICGPSEDWDEIAEATGDESWRGERMRRYFQRVERCHYARPSPWARLLALFGCGDGWQDSRHGHEGWLDVTMADFRLLLRDRMLLWTFLAGALAVVKAGAERAGDLLRATVTARLLPGLDPNHWQTMRRNRPGVTRVPVAITPSGQRSGPRERLLRLLEPGSPYLNRLHLRSGFCVTRLILEDDPSGQTKGRAAGVAGLYREHVYEADPKAKESPNFPKSDEVRLYCRKEVILCGGTFNTPQLLMVSGIGPADHLGERGIPVRVELPGVGLNLQDRYEVSVNATVAGRFPSLDGLSLDVTKPDDQLRLWIRDSKGPASRRGLYATTGGLMGLFLRSTQEEIFPDLFMFVIVGTFQGYKIGYSRPEVQLPTIPGDPPQYRRTLTWLILKARTRNRGGYVRLRSANALQRPEINFRSFPPGEPGPDADLEALHEGVEFVEQMLKDGKDKAKIDSYNLPGLDRFNGDRREWIKHTAWGHHACGTCRMGDVDDRMAVVDSRFRVRCTSGLRIVDASIFPRIPGFFVAASVYTIAEKAADTITEDHPIPADQLPDEARTELARTPIDRSRPDFAARQAYPAAMERAEAKLIAARRRAAEPESNESDAELHLPWLLSVGQAGERDTRSDALPSDTLGLALSGDGVRSAAFGLGVLQAMARADWLRRVDYLSTVSGGGYIGAFLGRYFDSYRMRRGEPDQTPGVVQSRVARGLADPDSAAVDWLRRHFNYLAPAGVSDAAQNLVRYVRSLLSFYLVLGAFFLAVFGSLDALSYLGDQLVGRGGVLGTLSATVRPWIVELSPISQNLPASWRGPWLALAEGSLWLAVVPLLLAYWLVSQDLPESFVAPVLIAAGLVAAASLLLTGSPLVLIIVTAAVFWSLLSWAAARREEGPADPRHPYRRMLAREHLNRRLTFWTALTVVLAAAWLIDRGGRSLAAILPYRGPTIGTAAQWLGIVGAAVLALTLILGVAAGAFAWVCSRSRSLAWAGQAVLWPVVAFVLGALPLMLAMSFVGHTMYGAGDDYVRGLAITVVAAVVSLLLGTRECLPLINRSGTFAVQAGRLARTFFGAVNPARRVHPEGQDINRPVAGDDVPFDQYHPEQVGGPLHIINCAVHETFDLASLRATRDRGAEHFAVGPVGVSVARSWHALWSGQTVPFRSLRSLGTEAPDPFLSRSGEPVRAEPLGLEDWVAISGASSGGGGTADRNTSRWQALYGLRSGYWWDSGLDAQERIETPVRGGLLGVLGAALARLFRSQTLLLSELTGRFGGPWTRHWYLSNGDIFDCTGVYELLRRRLPFIIVCDANAELEPRASSIARFVRLARADLGAQVTSSGPGPKALEDLGVPTEIAAHLGSLGDLSRSANHQSLKHASLLRVDYPDPPPGSEGDRYFARRHSWVLYIKTTSTGDEPVDVRDYAVAYPDFPDERTADPSFDERRWESYRQLGEHIGSCLFNRPAPRPPRC